MRRSTANPPLTSDDDGASEKVSPRNWLGVAAIGLGVFAFTTTEMVPIGLLTTMSSDLQVSEGVTGLAVTLYGAVAGVFAPVLTAATRKIDRRVLLVGILAIFIAGNAMTAVSTSFTVLLVSRLITGFAHGVMWSIAASIAVRLVPPASSVRATAIVFSGISIASVIGVPLGTFLGDVSSWRTAFWVISGFGGVILVSVFWLLPSLSPQGVVVLRDLPQLLRIRNLQVAVIVTAIVVVGHFCAYTYVGPYLEQVAGIETRWISVLLLLYGAAGIVGNFLSGALIGRALRSSLISFILGVAISIGLILMSGTWTPGVVIFLLAWGVAYTALPVALQTLVFRSAPDAPEAATSLFILSFNVAIAIGALLGGIAIDASGPVAVMVIGIVFSLAGAAIMFLRHSEGNAGPRSAEAADGASRSAVKQGGTGATSE